MRDLLTDRETAKILGKRIDTPIRLSIFLIPMIRMSGSLMKGSILNL